MRTPRPAPRSAGRREVAFRSRRFAVLVAAVLATAAAAQPLAGTYRGASDAGPTTVVLEQVGGALVGTLDAPGLRFGLEGEVRDGVGLGWVTTGQGTAGFEAHVQGDTLGLYLFELDAAGGPVAGSVIELILTRVVAASAPPAPAEVGPTLGGLGSPPGTAAVASPVLAHGAHGRLTEDAAHAFLEALEFVFAEIGVPYVFPEAERRAAVAALASAYPAASREEQLVLADARAIWERVRANWAGADLEARREFALGVLALAYGEETVAEWVGTHAGTPSGDGATGGGTGCATFEDCAGAYMDGQTWSDTFRTQGCWAAAGCQGYDVGTGTFDYGEGY